jgi:hypothetical protein
LRFAWSNIADKQIAGVGIATGTNYFMSTGEAPLRQSTR